MGWGPPANKVHPVTYTDDEEINNEPAPWAPHPLNMVALSFDDPAARQQMAASGIPMQQQPDMRESAPAAVPTFGAHAVHLQWRAPPITWL